MIAALLFRFTTVIVVNSTPLWRSFGPDANTWEHYGFLVLSSWTEPAAFGATWVEDLGDNSFYAILNALSIAVFGSARYPISFLNSFVGIFVAYLAGVLANQIYGRDIARRAFLLVLFYPSFLLWSSMNLREVWAHLAILVTLISAHSVRTRFSPTSTATLIGALFVTAMIRRYLAAPVLVGILASLVVVNIRQLPYAILGLGTLLGLVVLRGEDLGLTQATLSDSALLEIHNMRRGLAYGGSAYGLDADTRTMGGTLLYLPEGIARFLFAPFPWAVRSWQQALALPESMLFAVLFVQACRQLLRDLRDRIQVIIGPLMVVAVLTCAYGLVSGNEGTAFRHRAQIAVIVLVFSSAWQRRQRQTAVVDIVSVPSR